MIAICIPVLALCVVAVMVSDKTSVWTPLTAMLAVCAVIGTRVSFDVEGTLFWDGSFVPIICAVALLGPVPAVMITVLSEAAVWQRERYRPRVLPLNLVGTVVPNLAGALALAELGASSSGWVFYTAFAAIACACVALNAALVTALAGVLYNAPIVDRLRRQHGILAPVGVNVVLAMGAVAAYRAEGMLGSGLVLGGVFVFAFIARRLAHEREQNVRIRTLALSRGRLVAQILEAEDRERRLLADHVHDNLVQTLLVAKQDLTGAIDGTEADLSEVVGHLDEAIQQARGVIRATHPTVLDQVGLEGAIRAIAERSSAQASLSVDVDVAVKSVGTHDRIVFSVVRELVTNVVKHSKARQAEVAVRLRNDHITVTVADDGVGLPAVDLAALVSAGHVGLASVMERVEAVGGRVRVANRAPGTEVTITLPRTRAENRSLNGRALASVSEH